MAVDGRSFPLKDQQKTEDQTWALVANLWTFQFEMEKKP